MYLEYQKTVSNFAKNNLLSFKSNKTYNAILEHVSELTGKEYVNIILKLINESFNQISIENIIEYLTLNDKYGNPTKYSFTLIDRQIICSPTSLRYICHALIILKYINNIDSKKIVEMGCGYGGLFLAINYFSNILNIYIEKYYIIDLPEIGQLIELYLEKHRKTINIEYSIHSAYDYGQNINDDNLFFISNYCFTEIDNEHRKNYILNLFPKIKNGFIIWQTIFGLSLKDTNIISKEIKIITEEYPQTATITHKNYFVYF